MIVLTPPKQAFRHEALMYAGDDEFLAGTTSFIREGVEAGEPVLVVVGARKIDMLRAEVNGHSEYVCFADMDDVGANPARIIPAWRQFVDEHTAAGRPVRGIGEPIFPQRTPVEMVECHRHESLLNLAFADTPAFWLLCPYDTAALDPAVVAEARRTHPFVTDDGTPEVSRHYGGLDMAVAPFDEPLPEPDTPPVELEFDAEALHTLRTFVSRHADDAGLSTQRSTDFVAAVNEIATNSVRHGGGDGLLRIFNQEGALVCEVQDHGRIDLPLVGRERPRLDQIGGYGVWMANQLCDLVQVRTFADGSVVRLHMRDEPAS